MTACANQNIADTGGPFKGDPGFGPVEAPRPSLEAVARAEAFLKRPDKFTGEDRFAAAVACALYCRSEGCSQLDAWRVLENLNQGVCEPALEPSRLRDAIYAVYVEPVVADHIVADALAPNDARVMRATGDPPPVEIRETTPGKPQDAPNASHAASTQREAGTALETS